MYLCISYEIQMTRKASGVYQVITLRLKECMHFISNKLKEDVVSKYNLYLARERARKGGNLVGISHFSTVGLNPMKILSCIFSHFWNRLRDVFYSIRIE
jgi:hypothetical protein